MGTTTDPRRDVLLAYAPRAVIILLVSQQRIPVLGWMVVGP